MKKFFLNVQYLKKQRKFSNKRIIKFLDLSKEELNIYIRLYSKYIKTHTDLTLNGGHIIIDEAMFDCSILNFEKYQNIPPQELNLNKTEKNHPIWFYIDTVNPDLKQL